MAISSKQVLTLAAAPMIYAKKLGAQLIASTSEIPLVGLLRTLRAETVQDPTSARNHANLGVLHSQNSQRGIASAFFKRSIILDLSAPQFHRKYAKHLLVCKRLGDAEGPLRRAMILMPTDSESIRLLTLSYLEQEQFSAAHFLCIWARAINPLNAFTFEWLGIIDLNEQKNKAAIKNFRRALLLDPNVTNSMKGLARGLTNTGAIKEMISLSDRLVAADPTSAFVWVFRSTVFAWRFMKAPALDSLDRAIDLSANGHIFHSSKIFLMDHLPGCTFLKEQMERRAWWNRHGKTVVSLEEDLKNSRDPDRRLVIGYVSPDFRNHSASAIFGDIVLGHDRTRFSVILYSNCDREDDRTRVFEAGADIWRSVFGLSDGQLAAQIRNDQVDILVDLAGHSAGNRLMLFARKPAPIQVTAWGHAHGTGLPTIDYLFTDPVCIPANVRNHFAETCVDLPCVVPFRQPIGALKETSRPVTESGILTFGCLNRIEKITPQVIDLWVNVMRAIPDSRLLLKNTALDELESRNQLITTFQARGIGSDRIILRGATSRSEHLRTYSEIDIALDTFPQSGGLTSWEALFMGVPIVTLSGPNTAHRITHAILAHLDLSEWVAENESEFVAKAVQWGRNTATIENLSSGLRNRVTQSVAGDIPQYRVRVEQAYIEMWRQWCARIRLPDPVYLTIQ